MKKRKKNKNKQKETRTSYISCDERRVKLQENRWKWTRGERKYYKNECANKNYQRGERRREENPVE